MHKFKKWKCQRYSKKNPWPFLPLDPIPQTQSSVILLAVSPDIVSLFWNTIPCCACVCAKPLQLYPTLCDFMNRIPSGSSVMGFSRLEYWSGWQFPSPGYLPDPGIELVFLSSPVLAGRFFPTSTTMFLLLLFLLSNKNVSTSIQLFSCD